MTAIDDTNTGSLPLLYTREKTADMLGIHINTVDQMIKDGRLKAVHLPGLRRTFVNVDAIRADLVDGRHGG